MQVLISFQAYFSLVLTFSPCIDHVLIHVLVKHNHQVNNSSYYMLLDALVLVQKH